MATFPLLGLIASPAIPLTDSHLLGSYRQQGSPRPCLYMDSSLLLAMLGSQQGTSVQGLVPWFDFTLCAFVQLCAFSLPATGGSPSLVCAAGSSRFDSTVFSGPPASFGFFPVWWSYPMSVFFFSLSVDLS